MNSIGMKLVFVRQGTFLMGSPANVADQSGPEYQHEVEITRPFYMGIYEVAQEQYERVMGKNPSWFSPTGRKKDKVKGMDTRRFPVEMVTWDDAVEFCRRLSERPEEKSKGRVYRLPTEAEWEYACRGGPFIKNPAPLFHFGDSLSSYQANINGNFPYGDAPKGPNLERTSEVGSYDHNPLGLYDMHGNVWEWCADWYDSGYYQRSPRQDPQALENVERERHVTRGGSWYFSGIGECRAAYRGAGPGLGFNIGFRVVFCPRMEESNADKRLQQSASSPPQKQAVDLIGSGVQMEFVLIPKGKFIMSEGRSEHEVEITKPFYLAKYLVTQEQYKTVMKKNPSGFRGEQLPVETVSWSDAQAFCKTMRENDRQGHPFRLPTEAEWEYACRAGTRSLYFSGDDAKNLGEYAWFRDNSDNTTHAVGTRKPNPWGLYDMNGNLYQWCEDYYGPYDGLKTKDPLQSTYFAAGRVLRGCPWSHKAIDCRSAARSCGHPRGSWNVAGFRVAFSIE